MSPHWVVVKQIKQMQWHEAIFCSMLLLKLANNFHTHFPLRFIVQYIIDLHGNFLPLKRTFLGYANISLPHHTWGTLVKRWIEVGLDKVKRGLHRNFFPRKVSKTYNLQTCSHYDKAKSIDFEMRHLTKNLSMSNTSYEVVSILMWSLVNYFHVTVFC